MIYSWKKLIHNFKETILERFPDPFKSFSGDLHTMRVRRCEPLLFAHLSDSCSTADLKEFFRCIEQDLLEDCIKISRQFFINLSSMYVILWRSPKSSRLCYCACWSCWDLHLHRVNWDWWPKIFCFADYLLLLILLLLRSYKVLTIPLSSFPFPSHRTSCLFPWTPFF